MSKNIALCCSCNNLEFVQEGYEILERGGSALDAVIQVISRVEDDPAITDVGYNGFPNLMGEAELDASIMNGITMQSGAAVGIKHFKNPIKIAALIMNELPYDMLTADGAEQFARFMGMNPDEKMFEDSVKEGYLEFLRNRTLEHVQGEHDSVSRYKKEGFLQYEINKKSIFDFYDAYIQNHHGTVDAIALDKEGILISGVSTSGLAFRMPGRVSDSARIGAGNYANPFGAAGCTGMGELAVSFGLAHSAVHYLQTHNNPAEAVKTCIQRLNSHIDQIGKPGPMSILVMDREGVSASACNKAKNGKYGYQTNHSNGPQHGAVDYVPLKTQGYALD